MSTQPLRVFKTKRKSLELGKQTHVVGILNLTPDSFSDGGEYLDLASAVDFFHKMAEAGASIIDIGGESTRPNHLPVSITEEMNRVIPFVETIRSQTDCLISIDTSKAEVAKASLEAGADIINDIWGAQRDPRMADVIAEYQAGCILMHNRESRLPNGENLMNEILVFLKRSIKTVLDRGVNPQGICIDPGLGFGKNYDDNWEIMRNLERLHDLEVPVLLGASRKSMLAQLLTIKEPKDRLSGTLATTALAAMNRIDFVRVHDVKENIECAKVIDYCTNYEKN